jgi:hypothetical protein
VRRKVFSFSHHEPGPPEDLQGFDAGESKVRHFSGFKRPVSLT